ncbi:MAG: alpha/beta hydrolase [Rhodospirillaceae bacterium]|jgi:pimeloyl-ACP methyl ester carboxylesterase|nr:alpha/beta hydrolase [Rhodospirillaceae bacterium]MBT5240038.1 alpha/beta hydrolase [Rhodospirillaceae bacterium]MBT5566401.1 alpha/beta hydrolase [Rhodospirillaceae bacterium]
MATRTFIFGLAALMMAPMLGVVPSQAEEAMRGTSNDDWQGWGVLSGGKGYAASPLGQVHYRDIGPRDYEHPIVLLHQSPMSMIQFAEVQNALAELGVRAITIDTPGYGSSDKPQQQPTIQEYGNNLVYVLDHLNLEKVLVAGHHTGAQIAAAFAANNPDRAVGVILHGAALFNAEERASYQSRMGKGKPRTPVLDGSHLTRMMNFPMSSQEQKILDAKTWLAITSFIQGPDIGHWAAFHYDMEPDLKAINVPGMILTDTEDDVHYIDVRVSKMRPDFKYMEFSDGNLLELMAQPQRWAKIAAEFADGIEN